MMFDELRCHYPLPVSGANGLLFQTKDTDAQFMDLYEIRADGSLWHETYDIEDRSDPDAAGLRRFAGIMTRVNPRWTPVMFTGEIRFYTTTDAVNTEATCGWLEFSAYFDKGELTHLRQKERLPHHANSIPLT